MPGAARREGHGSSSPAFRAAFRVENFNVSTAVKIHCLVSGLLTAYSSLLAAYASACDHPTLAAALSGTVASKPRGIVYLSPINTILLFWTTLLFGQYIRYILDDFKTMAYPSVRTYSLTFLVVFGCLKHLYSVLAVLLTRGVFVLCRNHCDH